MKMRKDDRPHRFDAWAQAWNLLDRREKRQAWVVLGASILGGLAQVAMVGSIMPFLTHVSQPDAEPGRVARGLMYLWPDLGGYDMALALGSVALISIVLSSLVLMARSYVIARYATMRVHAISYRLLRSYLSRPYGFFLGRQSSDLAKRVLSETSEISMNFLIPAAEMIAAALSSLFILAFMGWVQPVGTAMAAGGVLLVYLLIYRGLGRKAEMLGRARAQANQERFQSVNEVVEGIKEIKVAGSERQYLERFEQASLKTMGAVWRARVIADLPRYLVHMLFFAAIVCVVLLLLDPARFDGTGFASLVPAIGTFALAGQRLVPELQRVYSALSQMRFGRQAISNVAEDMSDRSAPAEPAPPPRGDIRFEKVSYHYQGVNGEKASGGLRDVSLTIAQGERIGIVGGTGAGKTTFIDLLLGLLEPQEGEVLIGGTALDKAELRRAWRESVSYVPQHIFLASGSIAQNIAFGVAPGDIDMERVRECARIACIADHVEGLPDGFLTEVGDRGVALSGGQRQRIGLARALYRGGKVLVLDEATSALDMATERQVTRNLEEMGRDMTVISIAHRLETLRNADKMILLDHGALVAMRPWGEMERNEPLFRAMLRT